MIVHKSLPIPFFLESWRRRQDHFDVAFDVRHSEVLPNVLAVMTEKTWNRKNSQICYVNFRNGNEKVLLFLLSLSNNKTFLTMTRVKVLLISILLSSSHSFAAFVNENISLNQHFIEIVIDIFFQFQSWLIIYIHI